MGFFMKISEAFFETFTKVKLTTRRLASFRHDDLAHTNTYGGFVYYFIGRAAEYIIGYPLGLIAACFAAAYQAIINLFKPQNNEELKQEMTAEDIHTPDSSPIPSLLVTKIAVDVLERDQNDLRNQLISVLSRLINFIQKKGLGKNQQQFQTAYEQMDNLKRELDVDQKIAEHPENIILLKKIPAESPGKPAVVVPVEDTLQHMKLIQKIGRNMAKQEVQLRKLTSFLLPDNDKNFAIKFNELKILLAKVKDTHSSIELVNFYRTYKKILTQIDAYIKRKVDFNKSDFMLDPAILPESQPVTFNGGVFFPPTQQLVVSTVTSDFEGVYTEMIKLQSR